jgi:hypothetical protein
MAGVLAASSGVCPSSSSCGSSAAPSGMMMAYFMIAEFGLRISESLFVITLDAQSYRLFFDPQMLVLYKIRNPNSAILNL